MKLVFKKNLKPKPVIGAYKYSVHWVEGGSKLKYLSGSMKYKQVFKFKNFNFNLNFFDLMFYSFEKFKQKQFYNYLISYMFRKNIK